MSFTQMLFAADFCPPFDPGLKFSKKSKTSRPAEIYPVFIWAYKYDSDIENSWQNPKIYERTDQNILRLKIRFLGRNKLQNKMKV